MGGIYSKILVPLDGSRLAEQVLPYVRLFASTLSIPVELLWVNDPEIIQWPPRSGQEYLRQASAEHLPGLKQIAVIEADGKPADAIARRAAAEADCLVAMATHGISGLRRWLIGSVASKVCQLAQNPLLLIRPSEGADPRAPALKSIFLPLDGSGLAEQALPHAVELTKKFAGALQLLRAYQLSSEAYLVADGVIVPGAAQFRAELEEEIVTYLQGKIETLRAGGFEAVAGTALEGDAASEIIELASKTTDSLVVMSTHGRTGVGRWLLGSVAEKVIQHARAPVLLIRAS